MSRQAEQILADLARHKTCFDFHDGRLGEDVAEACALGIYVYMDYQVDSSGTPWQPLSKKYREWKEKKAPGMLMAELEGTMKTMDQLIGQLEYFPEGMAQTYGTDAPAQDEAEWFQEGNDKQPKREFYDFNDLAVQKIDEVLDARFASIVR